MGNIIPEGACPSAIHTVSEELLSQASEAGTWCPEPRGKSSLCSLLHWPGALLKKALPHAETHSLGGL